MGLTLDTGALIAFERNVARVAHIIRAQQRRGRSVTVPAPVVAQYWRGGYVPAHVRGLLAEAHVEPTTAALARQAGELLGRTGTSDAVDGIVACSAASRGDVVLTSDPHDMQLLADDLRTIRVATV